MAVIATKTAQFDQLAKEEIVHRLVQFLQRVMGVNAINLMLQTQTAQVKICGFYFYYIVALFYERAILSCR